MAQDRGGVEGAGDDGGGGVPVGGYFSLCYRNWIGVVQNEEDQWKITHCLSNWTGSVNTTASGISNGADHHQLGHVNLGMAREISS